jgi:putative FmdB family regulatory protein
MPYYEYECQDCGNTFVEKQTFEQHDKHEKTQCPKCHSQKVEQLVGSVFTVTSKKS